MNNVTTRGSRRRFTDEEKSAAVAVIRRGEETIEQVATSLGVTVGTIKRWRGALSRAEKAAAPPVSERQRLRQLERENKQLTQQLEILRKFEAFVRRNQK